MRHVIRRLVAVAAAAMTVSMLAVPVAGAASPTWSHRDLSICGPGSADTAACLSVVRQFYENGQAYHAQTPGDLKSVAKAAASISYTATDIRAAYGITGVGDPSRVIAIVDAYDDPAAFTNLTTYRATLGSSLAPINNCPLSQLTSLTSSATTPCFTKIDQSGGTSYPSADAGWSNEIDLDLQAASAVCPRCSILLVEANSASFADLGAAVTEASGTAHVLAISNSYGSSSDVSGVTYPQWDNAANKGIAVMASTGDGGYGVGFPATATYVIGVGGTTLAVDTGGARSTETAWSGSGSGCSTYNAAPSWQVISGNPCNGKKAIADLSADADPYSGLQIYTTYSGKAGWYVFGGTSLSSPLMGALYAMQGGYGSTPLAGAYAWASTTPHYDVTSGSNGRCRIAVLCNAGTGWDGPTGLGSIQMSSSTTQTLGSITVTPSSATVAVNGTQQFTATAYDTTGVKMATQPTVTWSVASGGVGSIDSGSGLYSAGTTAGTATVTATSGSVSGTASVTVTAAAPDFTIAVSPSSLTAKRGTTATYTVTIGAVDGFAGSVTLSLAGAPAGSTVTFTPNPASGTASLTITTSTSTKAKTYPMTVTGTSGSLAHTASISLRVTTK